MIIFNKVSKVFPTGVAGLSDVSLAINKGEFAFITGTTGSGKTTLLKVIIREVLPTAGDVLVADVDVVKLPNKNIPHFRKKIGVIFQDLKLLPDRTILENVLLPMEIAGTPMKDAIEKANGLLEDVGLSEHADKFPIQLSGGELQRVAIARALTLNPEIIIADEPTGNLDQNTAVSIVDLLHAINKRGTTIVMVTHNKEIIDAYKDHRVIVMDKGKVITDTGQTQKGAPVVKETISKHAPAPEKHDQQPAAHAKAKHEEPVADVFSGTIEEKIETKKGD